jgi:hypothetical protein
MDGLILVQEARRSGLTLIVEGDRLSIHGPQTAEPIARLVVAHKAEVMAALAQHALNPKAVPVPNRAKLTDSPSDAPDSGRVLPDLSKVLPPLEWLTTKQRRLWRQRAAYYRSTGYGKADAEQEALAELVMGGAFYRSAE